MSLNTFHVIQRTSPKGEGQTFRGVCLVCGMTDLPMAAACEVCPSAALSCDDALLLAIDGPRDDVVKEGLELAREHFASDPTPEGMTELRRKLAEKYNKNRTH